MGAVQSNTTAATTHCSGYISNVTHCARTASGREFYFHLPAGYDCCNEAPVVFSFHGAGKNATQQEKLSGLSCASFNPSAIAVYPESIGGYWLSHPGVSEKSPNDIDFTLDVLSWLDKKLKIDKTRIYATGKSNGGGLVNLLACNATSASKFAAFAPVSGAYYEDKLAKECSPGRPIPIVSFHGLNDTTIPYTGKVGDKSQDFKNTYPIPQWLRDWVKRNGITDTKAKNTTGLYGGLVTQEVWNKSGKPALLTHYKENNLGHVWPSLHANPDCPSPSSKCPLGHYTFNATTVIMEFFSHWHL